MHVVASDESTHFTCTYNALSTSMAALAIEAPTLDPNCECIYLLEVASYIASYFQ